MKINYETAADMITVDEEMSERFTLWLKENRDKEAYEWDADDLGEFFRSLGYETEV